MLTIRTRMSASCAQCVETLRAVCLCAVVRALHAASAPAHRTRAYLALTRLRTLTMLRPNRMSTEQEAPGSERGPIAAFVQAHRLSPQEARLIKAALRELSNEEIASELGCSASTIRTYWSRIFQKVGCSRHHHVFARLARFAVTWGKAMHASCLFITVTEDCAGYAIQVAPWL
jgi:DNA-binding CsgD family transcriptional regulator